MLQIDGNETSWDDIIGMIDQNKRAHEDRRGSSAKGTEWEDGFIKAHDVIRELVLQCRQIINNNDATNEVSSVVGAGPTTAEMNLAKKSFDFGIAICHLKAGRRVARAGWNGKGMFLTYSPGHQALPADKIWSPHLRQQAVENGGTLDILPCIMMKTADNKAVAWLASQTDMLATDWEVVE